MNALAMIAKWEGLGRKVPVFGREIFTVDTGGANLPVLLILHGYPSSSFDYRQVIPLLKNDFRIIVHDHLGFGLSNKPLDYSYSLIEQAETALELWKQLGIDRAHLLAHDYGTSVATEILARKRHGDLAIDLKSVTLSNGSIHIEMTKLRFIQKLLRHRFWGPVVARISNQAIYVHQMKRLWYDGQKCDVDELKALWHMNSVNNGIKVLPRITQYLHERYRFWNRWISALETLEIPAHIVWAQEDPVAVKEIGEQLHNEIPGSVITRIEKAGHYPMLEVPEIWANSVNTFLQSLINRK